MKWCVVPVVLGACTQVIDHGIGDVLSDCPAPIPLEITGPSGSAAPAALEYPAGSLWFWPNGRAFVPSAEDACSKLAFLSGPVVPLLTADAAENATRTDGKQIMVEPIGGFVAAGRGYVYYRKNLYTLGSFYFEYLGTALCTLDSPDAPCQRIGPEPLWGPGDRATGGPGFVDADGYAYMMSCRYDWVQSGLCMVTRVLPEQAGDRSAYTYADGSGGWTSNTAEAAVTLHALFATPSYLAARHAYIAVFPVVSDQAHPALRVGQADRPAGPYGAEATMFPAEPSDNFFISGGREHAGLRRDDVVTVTYDARTSRTLVRAVHVVRFAFASSPPKAGSLPSEAFW